MPESEKDFYDKVAYHLKALSDLCKGRALMLSEEVPTTSTGRIMDINERIDLALADRPGMTTVQLTDTLYRESMGISKDLFRRRVAVAISHKHRKLGTVHGERGTGREMKWTLKQ